MRDITLVVPFYENPVMFAEQQRVWAAYPDDLKARLHIIVVDDGSPDHPAVEHVQQTGVDFALYRTLIDIRWNWLFCRNLAMANLTTEWALMTDIDHVLPTETLSVLTHHEFDPAIAYRLNRVDMPNLTPNPKPHPNTWFMTRELFDRCGGYDERFSGYYGTDGEFRRRLEKVADTVLLPDVLIRYPRAVLADADTTRYGRKEAQDTANVTRIFRAREASSDRAPKRLTFPWERVA